LIGDFFINFRVFGNLSDASSKPKITPFLDLPKPFKKPPDSSLSITKPYENHETLGAYLERSNPEPLRPPSITAVVAGAFGSMTLITSTLKVSSADRTLKLMSRGDEDIVRGGKSGRK